MSHSSTAALVLFSGGQDSTTCLAWALERFGRVETVGFDYGQRHRIELDCRETVRRGLAGLNADWGSRLGPDHMLDATVLRSLGETAMTHDVSIEMTEAGLPSTFVPGRNLLFLTLAGALASRRGISVLVGGMCETDYSGYPDCRPAYIEAFETMANLATKSGVEASAGDGRRIIIHAPLIDLTKAGIIARRTGLGVDYSRTMSCYDPVEESSKDGFLHCGRCDDCVLRKKGFAEAGFEDPTAYHH